VMPRLLRDERLFEQEASLSQGVAAELLAHGSERGERLVEHPDPVGDIAESLAYGGDLGRRDRGVPGHRERSEVAVACLDEEPRRRPHLDGTGFAQPQLELLAEKRIATSLILPRRERQPHHGSAMGITNHGIEIEDVTLGAADAPDLSVAKLEADWSRRALEERRRCGHSTPALRTAGRSLQLCRDCLVGARRCVGLIPVSQKLRA